MASNANQTAHNQPKDLCRLTFRGDEARCAAVREIQPSPCTLACPAGVNVKGYVSLIAAGKFYEALEVVRRNNPFPAICGRVCHHPCEAHCRRALFDEPVAICWLKRYVADYEMSARPRKRVSRIPASRSQKVAVVGSGPAGLTAASDLVRLGFAVTIFEAHSEPGGMFVLGIPEFRLPRPVIQYEIQQIIELGAELKTGVRIGRDINLEELVKRDGFDAVFLGLGAHLPRGLEIPGDQSDHVEDALAFMRRINLGDRAAPGRRVLVIGGGHSAIDCARTAVRLGAEDVHIIYRRTEEEMPAGRHELQQALDEGVRVSFLASPVRVVRRGDKVTGLEVAQNRLGQPDASGRRRPVPIPDSNFAIPADRIISAVGQKTDSRLGTKGFAPEVSRWGTLAVDGQTLATSLPGVFAGGDAATGPRTVIEAIAQGHLGARSIFRHLNDPASSRRARKRPALRTEFEIETEAADPAARAPMPRLDSRQRLSAFDEVELGFSRDAAIEEANRCLRCGPCSECSLCVAGCPKSHLNLSLDGQKADWRGLVLRTERNNGRLRDGGAGQVMPVDLATHADPPSSQAAERGLLQPLACSVRPVLCRGCGLCVEVCQYGAPGLVRGEDGAWTSVISAQICKGCGVCVSVCPSSAIVPSFLDRRQIHDRWATVSPMSKIVVFCCGWNGRADGFAAGEPSAAVEWVPVMCAGRIDPALVLDAFHKGADGVAVAKCDPGSCHYGFGSQVASENLQKTSNLLRLLGIGEKRLKVFSAPAVGDDSFWNGLARFARGVRKREASHG